MDVLVNGPTEYKTPSGKTPENLIKLMNLHLFVNDNISRIADILRAITAYKDEPEDLWDTSIDGIDLQLTKLAGSSQATLKVYLVKKELDKHCSWTDTSVWYEIPLLINSYSAEDQSDKLLLTLKEEIKQCKDWGKQVTLQFDHAEYGLEEVSGVPFAVYESFFTLAITHRECRVVPYDTIKRFKIL